MKKARKWIILGFLPAIFIGFLVWIYRPPLEIGGVYRSDDRESVVVVIGNSGYLPIKVRDVSINDKDAPTKANVQVSHALQGIIITKNYEDEESKKYQFRSLQDVAIQTGTDPKKTLEKFDDGSVTEEDLIYGLSVLHSTPITEVTITYSYLGMSFHKTVSIP